MISISELDFSKSEDGLIPAVVQDYMTKNVLMLGFVNSEAIQKTLDTKRVTFYSRSKQRLWTKGEETGNFLELKSIKMDCDNDSLLILWVRCATREPIHAGVNATIQISVLFRTSRALFRDVGIIRSRQIHTRRRSFERG